MFSEREEGGQTNFKVVLVGQGITGELNLRLCSKNLLAHLVHGGLDRGTLVLGENLHGNVAGGLPGSVKTLDTLLDSGHTGKALPTPGAVDICGKNAVPGLAECGVLVPDEAVERGASALENSKIRDSALEIDALTSHSGLDIASLLAVTVEAVGVRLAIDVHAGPPVDDDFDVGGRDVGILVEEVLAKMGGIELWGVHRVFLGLDVDCVLDGVGGNDYAVVGLGVTIRRR